MVEEVPQLQKIKQLKDLLDADAITQEEYDTKKAELLLGRARQNQGGRQPAAKISASRQPQSPAIMPERAASAVGHALDLFIDVLFDDDDE